VPYLHAGYYRSYGLDEFDFEDNELAVGAGLLHNLRLTDRLDLIIDMRGTVANGRLIDASGISILGSVTAGLAVDLGNPNFIRTSTLLASEAMAAAEQIAVLEAAALALEVANAALLDDNQRLADVNNALAKENGKLRNRMKPEPDLSDMFYDMTPVVYFEIGKSVLSPIELKHLEFIADNLIAKADDGTEVVITVMGTADSNTGTTRRNKYLSEARGRYVYDILVNEYGVNPDCLVLASDIVQSEQNPEFDRAVLISF
jgi:outer membrane protein OmpA-like peptidoglycan-associated protein